MAKLRLAVVLAVVATGIVSPAAGQAPMASVMRPGALDDIPRHLTEIGWDTDLPALLTIRFMPEKMNFEPSWSTWVTGEMLKVHGYGIRPAVDPWPPFFRADRAALSGAGGRLLPADMQAFQAWCLRRSQVIPRIIVQAVPYVAPMAADDASDVRLRPLGLAPGQPRDGQRVEGVGFSQMIYLGLTRDADDDAVSVPRDVLATLPPVGVTLETRLRWSDPTRVGGTLFVPGEPQSLRLVADRRVLWEHTYAAPGSGEPAPAPAPAPTRPAPRLQSDITF